LIRRALPAAAQVLVVSEQALARVGYKAVLDSANYRVELALSVEDGLALVGSSPWDLVILDLPGLDKITLVIAELRLRSPGVPILVVCELPEKQVARIVLKAGARGYFHKSASVEALRSAIQTVLVGRRYLTATLTEQLASDPDDNWRKALHERLSARELEVFEKIASGASVTQIGSEMSLSVKTVSTYRLRILRKMGFTCNADIITYALRNGLRH
jgi:two-component system invasion response regulator UvrY